MPSNEFLMKRANFCAVEEGMIPPFIVKPERRVIFANDLSASSRARIEGILHQEFDERPRTLMTNLDVRLLHARQAIGELPSAEVEAAKVRAGHVAAVLHGRVPDPERDERVRQAREALAPRTIPDDVAGRLASAREALYGRRRP